MAKQAVASISLGRTGGVLPDGVYKMRIKGMELKQGAKSPYLAAQFSVEGKSSTIFANIMLGDNVRWKLEEFLDAVQAPTTGQMSIVKLIQFCRGKVVYGKLGNETYQDRLKNVIDKFLTEEVALQLMAEQPATPQDPEEDEDYEEDADEDSEEEDDDWGDDDDEDAPKDEIPF